jgi:transposase
VRVLGVDDWAFKKGQRYGTLLVDLERHCLLDLLPEHSATSLAAWLKAHPGIEVICRDRASVYAEGARQGAPCAQQVADRFHLGKNLVEALQRLVGRHHRFLQEAAAPLAQALVSDPVVPIAMPLPTAGGPVRQTRTQQQSLARRQRRLERYEQVMTLYRQGVSRNQIAHVLQIDRRTVSRFVCAETFPERAPPARRANQLDRFAEYLRTRWEAGCHNAAQLFRELQAQGFTGAQSGLRPYLRGWRKPLSEKACGEHALRSAYSARRTTWLLLGYAQSKEASQQAQDAAFLERLTRLCPIISQGQELVKTFFEMMRARQGDALQSWMDQVLASGIAELSGFARGLNSDLEAVIAGLTQVWSNGQTEGQVNRLKLIKRQMYGRAHFELLRARVLPMGMAA